MRALCCAALGTRAYKKFENDQRDLNCFICASNRTRYTIPSIGRIVAGRAMTTRKREWSMLDKNSGSRECDGVNGFIDSLCPADQAMLVPQLIEVDCLCGDNLGANDEDCRYVYFPLTLVACLGAAPHNTGTGLIGREGIIGWSAVLGEDSGMLQATVLLDGGRALAIRVDQMRDACLASATLALSLLRFLQSYTLQLSEMLRARDNKTLKQRLCAWLLMLHDRVDGDLLPITHTVLAAHLGVRRASVTDTLHLLEGEMILRCKRGMILVRDRASLERAAGLSHGNRRISSTKNPAPFMLAPQPDADAAIPIIASA